MPRKFIKKYLPDPHSIKKNRAVNMFGSLLHDANLWHLNRKSARGAFAVGLFNAFVPIPFQMWLSAVGAIVFKVNLPLSVALVWISNPLTMPPMFYGCYLVGEMILGDTGYEFAFEPSWDWLVQSLSTIGPTFIFGCFIVSSVSAIIGYFGINWLWRYSVAKAWRLRQEERANRTK
ncbi:DUF2062 domain-containing protein [Psychrosphaera sp. 1_MG-2023]|uniref:DUF2062 domain-containing protein n=1 Tax=Psychrosphaera sp. 1_MG-2023 TaxID=3062643 RepID=UPI0026E3D829|nr:DUF2062 domain-containing protein [Psychrosphaera sp. 1_MG-2023]MDO6720050.1 DUF2062 domain-containing protein [Psychrosphaera sp. 1_MG-2023]